MALRIKDNVDLKELESFGYDIFDFDYVSNRHFEPPVCRILIKQINKKGMLGGWEYLLKIGLYN